MASHKWLILIIVVLVLGVLPSCGHELRGPTHGTLITVLGNKQGIVVVADSMRSYVDNAGRVQQMPTFPAQKLMLYDKSTVCATAGILTYGAVNKKKPISDRQILPQLNLQILGIVQAYRDAVRQSGQPQPMIETLRGLSGALRGRFTILANLDDYFGHGASEIVLDYYLQLRLVGFDLDGEPKIGSLNLLVVREQWPDGRVHWTAKENEPPDTETVHDVLIVRSAGIDAVEKEMLSHPNRFANATLMQDYIKAQAKDGAASVSIEFMKKLGHLFKLQTGYEEASVGGADQIAVITRGKDVELEGLDSFQPIRNPVAFVKFLCSSTPLVMGDTIATGDSPIAIFQSCTFIGGQFVMGSSLFLHCTFNNVQMIYDGGDVLLEEDNTISNGSRLRLSPGWRRRPDLAAKLMTRFDFMHGGTGRPHPDDLSQPGPTVQP